MKRKPRPLHLLSLEDRTVPSSVQGTVFNDANNNGVFDTGETGVSGWTVFVDNSNGTIHDPGEAAAVTDANGNFLIDTTSIPPSGNGWNYFHVELQVGSGGRWLNTTASTVYAHPVNEPLAVRDFGVHFQPYVSVEPDGPETLVNVTTAGVQQAADTGSGGGNQLVQVASDAAGNYVVAWQGPNVSGVPTDYARVFNADGSPRTGELAVTSGSNITLPQVAMADNGRFVVLWTGSSSSGNNSTFVRVYNANGTPATSAVTVTTDGYFSGVAMDAVGNFAVLYFNFKRNHGKQLYVQRFTAIGASSGKAIAVAELRLMNGESSIAMDGTGRFVVVWDDVPTTGNVVYAQRFSATGQKVGSQMTVTSNASTIVWQSNVVMNGSGRFVVTWNEWTGTGKAQVFDWGTPVGGPVTLGPTGGVIRGSDLESDGDFTFAWSDGGEARFGRLTAGGVLESALVANTTTEGIQSSPGVAVTGNDRFVVAWQGYGPGDNAGIFVQRFKPIGMSPIGNSQPKSDGANDDLTRWIDWSLIDLNLAHTFDRHGGATIRDAVVLDD